MVQQRMEMFWQKEMKHDELTQPGWEDTADYFRDTEKMYGTSELRVPAVDKLQSDYDSDAPALTTFEELMEGLQSVPAESQRLRGTSRPGSIDIALGSGKPQSSTSIPGHASTEEPYSPLTPNAKSVDHVRFYRWIQQPQ